MRRPAHFSHHFVSAVELCLPFPLPDHCIHGDIFWVDHAPLRESLQPLLRFPGDFLVVFEMASGPVARARRVHVHVHVADTFALVN